MLKLVSIDPESKLPNHSRGAVIMTERRHAVSPRNGAMKLSIFSLLVFSLVFAAVPGHTAASFKDDFSTYKTGSDGSPNWDTDNAGWSVDAGKMMAETGSQSFALYQRAGRMREGSVEATLSIASAPAKDWKVAGVALCDDARNYWHLALIESPDPDKKRFIELQESYAGAWLATSAEGTKLTPISTGSFEWDYNHPYRLRIDLTSDSIVGTISELDGTQKARLGYKFDNKAVTEGQAALDCSGFKAAFSDFAVAVGRSAPPRPVTEASVPSYDAKGYKGVHGKATGFFHVDQVDGHWWLITPKGDGFFAVGTDHANYNAHFCEKLGYAPYHKNCVEKYGGDEEAWGVSTAKRLKSWGFNALGCGWSATMKEKGLPRCEFLSFGSGFSGLDNIAPKTTWTGFPDVFSPQWPVYCDKVARRMAGPLKSDPWIIGYFLDNELEWFGKDGAQWGLFDESVKKPAGHPAKEHMIALLKGRHATIEAFNAAWGVHFADWESLRNNVDPIQSATAAATADRMAFVHAIADRYFSAAHAALKKWDPNHLDLGCRFAGFAPDGAVAAAGKVCDVVSVNFYGNVDLQRGVSTDMPPTYENYFAECKRPMMITEWSFPAYDSGLPCLHGAGQRVPTQKDRAECFRIYQAALMRLPFMVGSNYFMWVDEPALGISTSFPEDSNYGLVNERDEPWSELTAAAAKLNPRVYAIHSGDIPEIVVSVAPDGKSFTVRNTGGSAASFECDVWVDGQKQIRHEKLGAHAQRTEPIIAAGTNGMLVTVIADPGDLLGQTDRSASQASALVYRGSSSKHAARGEVIVPIVVANPSSHAITEARVSARMSDITPLPGKSANLRVLRVQNAASGLDIPYQVDGAPGSAAAELELNAGSLAPYASRTILVYTRPRTAAESQATLAPAPDADFRFDTGSLVLEHKSGSGDLLSGVSIGDLRLGRLLAVMHEQLPMSLWVSADRPVDVKVYRGPVCMAADVTVECKQGGSETKTAVNTATGDYAPQQVRPHRFRTTYRIAAYPGESWFSSRLLSITNSDTEPWILNSYYHYALSAIGGDRADDIPAVSMPSGTVGWQNAKKGAFYGCLGPAADFKMTFWKDPGPDGGQHPDVWREVKIKLEPGKTDADPQPQALFFGCAGGVGQVRAIAARSVNSTGVLWKKFGSQN